MSLIRAEAVERTFGSGPAAVRALRGVTLELQPGGLTVLKGRSGSGKTTLLNLLGGLDRPTRGRVLMDGQDLAQLSRRALTQLRLRRIGFVFQSFGLLPLLSAAENVELPLRIAGLPPAARAERAKHWLDFVGLKERMAHRPYELSGGEQQRTALARALAGEPALILADEPTSAVDSRIAAQILQLLHRITRETGVAICLTTHDPSVMEVADVVYELSDGALVHEE